MRFLKSSNDVSRVGALPGFRREQGGLAHRHRVGRGYLSLSSNARCLLSLECEGLRLRVTSEELSAVELIAGVESFRKGIPRRHRAISRSSLVAGK
jgi:hypothetical protein